jgi:spore coat polysaccharide biosynthesis protein SpsF (cytidylyltransferase family)
MSLAEIDEIQVATTAEPANRPLLELLASEQIPAFAYQGSCDDLVGRVDALYQARKAGILLYICGDCPLIEGSTLARLLSAAQEYPDRLPRLPPPPKGKSWVHEGFDVYPAQLWQSLVAHSRSPAEREHLGLGLGNFSWQAQLIAEPEIFAVRQKPRLSVDTQADYQAMERLHQCWREDHSAAEPVALPWALTQLSQTPAGNASVHQRSPWQDPLNIAFLCASSGRCGMGHLSRCRQMARALQEDYAAGTHLFIVGDSFPWPPLRFLNHSWTSSLTAAREALVQQAARKRIHLLVIDLPASLQEGELRSCCPGARLALLDPSTGCDLASQVDLKIHPGVFDLARTGSLGGLRFLPTDPQITAGNKLDRLLVLPGGSDAFGLGQKLPQMLSDFPLPIDWVCGPLAAPPQPVGNLVIQQNPDIPALLRRSGLALCPFGFSFWECLQAGARTCVISNPALPEEMAELRALDLAEVVDDLAEIPAALNRLLAQSAATETRRKRGMELVDGKGASRLATALVEFLAATP